MKKKIQAFFNTLCGNPQKALLFYIGCSIVCWTLQCALLQNVLGLDVVEVLIWGNQGWVWGHAKHPPLSGWLGGLFRMLSGGHDWSLYLAAQLAMMGGIWFTYCLGMRLFHDRFRAAASALLLCFLHYYTPSEMRFCTYPVAMFLNPLIVWSFVAALQSRKIWYFLIFGTACGLAVLNKYSCAVLLLTLLTYSFCNKECRKLWRTPGPYCAGVIFFALIAPHVFWLFQHDLICLHHVGDRLDETFRWYDPFLTVGATLYPFAAEALAVALCLFFTRRSLERKKPDWQIFRLMLLFTLPACLVLVFSSFCGKSVILMWFCTLASLTGIAVIAATPFEFGKAQFRVFYLILWIFASAVYLGATADLLFSSRERLHADPQTIVQIGKKMWRDSGRHDAIPLVVGDRWYGGVFENYSQEKTRCVEISDSVALRQNLEMIEQQGALLLISDDDQLKEFGKMARKASFFIKKVDYSYTSLLGRKRNTWFYAGFWNPRCNNFRGDYKTTSEAKAEHFKKEAEELFVCFMNVILDSYVNIMKKINFSK